MALSEHYDLNYLDPDEEISEFPNQWDHNIDKIDEAIHEAATNDVDLDRLPNLPASQTTSGEFAQARIPKLPASHINTGEFAAARIPDSIARTADVDDETAALDKRIADNADRLDDHGDRIEELENSGGDSGSKYRQEDIEPDTGEGSVSIERQGPLVFIWGSLSFESEVSSNTRVFSIPKWAQTDGICLMPCMTAGEDPSNVNLQVSGGSALSTADIAEDTKIYGSITFLTTKEMGDDDE